MCLGNLDIYYRPTFETIGPRPVIAIHSNSNSINNVSCFFGHFMGILACPMMNVLYTQDLTTANGIVIVPGITLHREGTI